MFLPQVAKHDIFDLNGIEQDDINSIIEYIDQVLLSNTDETPEDEDNDNGQNFQAVKCFEYFNSELVPAYSYFLPVSKNPYYEVYLAMLSALDFDIISPPPKV